MKSKIIVFIVVLVVAGIANAATEEEKETAIKNGLAYLATTQNGTYGYFGSGTQEYLISQTGSAVLAFLEEKDNWADYGVDYQPVVDAGIKYLLSKAVVMGISNQPAGNPDGDGNGQGLYFNSASNHDIYVSGLALPAIASSGTPDALVTAAINPVIAARTDGSGPGGQWTYKDVVQNAVDYFAYGQSEPGTVFRGGWRYMANQQSADNSTTQWPVIATLFAQKMGVTAPAFMKTELAYWTQYSQSMTPGIWYGAGGYAGPPPGYGELNETGSILIQQALLGWGPGNTRVDAAMAWINTHWQDLLPSSGFDGNFGNPYAMWAIYKGLELMIGVDDMGSPMTNLHADPGDVDNPDHGYNWWEDYCEWIVNNQLGGGSWSGFSYWGTALATPWYINILAATEIPQIPVPGAMLLCGIGLAFASRKLQRRKEL